MGSKKLEKNPKRQANGNTRREDASAAAPSRSKKTNGPCISLSQVIQAGLRRGGDWASGSSCDVRVSHFLIPLLSLFIDGCLLLKPFVRARPFVSTVALIGGLGCWFIAGEEMS